MIKKLKAFFKWVYPYAIPLIAGIILVFSFAPYNVATMAFLSLAALLYSLNGVSPKQGFIRGVLFGLGLFGLGASWIYVSIYNYGGESIIISSVITIGFVLILSLFTGLLGWLLNRFWPKNHIKRTLFAFPTLWVAIEILRGWLFTGFPWLYLGYSQTDTHLQWLAPIGSVWLVSWVVAFNAAVIYELFNYVNETKSNRKFLAGLLGSALIIWVGAGVVREKAWTNPVGELTVAMVQGNIPQALRWDSQAVNKIATTYQAMTMSYFDYDVIIWPESAIPAPLPYSYDFFKQMSQTAIASQSGFISGVPVKVEGKNSYYNALVSMGQGSGVYYKKHLVPFGEYVPFEKLLRGLIAFFDLPMSSFVKGPKQPPLITKGYRVAPAVCYEIAYPFTMRSAAIDSHVVVTVSNDAWFGRSIGPKQHLQIAQFRAKETGRYVLRATNNGFTVIIDNLGNIKKHIPAFEEGVLTGAFTLFEGKTPWMKFGHLLLAAWLVGFLGLSLVRKKDKK